MIGKADCSSSTSTYIEQEQYLRSPKLFNFNTEPFQSELFEYMGS